MFMHLKFLRSKVFLKKLSEFLHNKTSNITNINQTKVNIFVKKYNVVIITSYVLHRFVIPAPICNLAYPDFKPLPWFGIFLPRFEIL